MDAFLAVLLCCIPVALILAHWIAPLLIDGFGFLVALAAWLREAIG